MSTTAKDEAEQYGSGQYVELWPCQHKGLVADPELRVGHERWSNRRSKIVPIRAALLKRFPLWVNWQLLQSCISLSKHAFRAFYLLLND
jgi:hypothetical protein